jgi:hypothetical protein
MSSGVCCLALKEAKSVPSPFSRIIAFGYYDGPFEGVLVCEECAEEYVFRTAAWKHDEDIRIYELQRVARGAFDAVLAVCSALGTPTWPVWVPRWEFPTHAQQGEADRQLGSLLTAVSNQRLFVASEELERLIRAAAERVGESVEASLDEWLALMDLR